MANNVSAGHVLMLCHAQLGGSLLGVGLRESQNHRMVGRDLRNPLLPSPAVGRDTSHYSRLLQALSSLASDALVMDVTFGSAEWETPRWQWDKAVLLTKLESFGDGVLKKCF